MEDKGIDVIFKFKSGTTEIQGASFSKDGIQFKGSQIDRSLSYGNINKQLIINSQQETLAHAFKIITRENSTDRQVSNDDPIRQEYIPTEQDSFVNSNSGLLKNYLMDSQEPVIQMIMREREESEIITMTIEWKGD